MEKQILNFENWKSFRNAQKILDEAQAVLDSNNELNEGKTKELAMIAKEATSKEDYRTKLKSYLKSIDKNDLSNDDEAIKTMVDAWKEEDVDDEEVEVEDPKEKEDSKESKKEK